MQRMLYYSSFHTAGSDRQTDLDLLQPPPAPKTIVFQKAKVTEAKSEFTQFQLPLYAQHLVTEKVLHTCGNELVENGKVLF